jgi:poly-gamma-glutamate capsule biosynthesis protein CapA/YwtB (metallophosphatase superfamily)
MHAPFSLIMTGQSLIQHDIRNSSDPGFAHIVRLLRQADVAFTNFENTILGSHGGWPMKGSYFGCALPVVLDALKDIGFNALSLANNHAFDLGPPGILSTLTEVNARDFLHAGIGVDRDHALAAGARSVASRDVALVAMDAGPGPATMYADNAMGTRPARPGVNGLKVMRTFEVEDMIFDMLATLQTTFQSSGLERANYAQPHDPPQLDPQEAVDFYGNVFRRAQANRRQILVDRQSAELHISEIANATARGKFVIAYLHHHHWEPDWRDVPSWIRSFAHDCIEAGAHTFVSHGAPVLQPIEIYNGAPIFFGLGNFIFHTEKTEGEWDPPEVWSSVVATCMFDADDELRSIELLPIVLDHSSETDCRDDRVPTLATGQTARRIIADLTKRSRRFGTAIVEEDGTGKINLSR